jgi:rubrerythrin
MKEKTKKNIYTAFIGEAKAYFRLLAYAERAEEEDVPQIALLFRAIAEAEKVHATRQLNLVKDMLVKDTDTNLKKSFNREKSVTEVEYPALIQDAEEEGEEAASIAFSQARDAESYHMKLYDRAIYHLIKDEIKAYHVCGVCGYITDKPIPDECPICGAGKDKFKTVGF